jgi:hypothetical protein
MAVIEPNLRAWRAARHNNARTWAFVLASQLRMGWSYFDRVCAGNSLAPVALSPAWKAFTPGGNDLGTFLLMSSLQPTRENKRVADKNNSTVLFM